MPLIGNVSNLLGKAAEVKPSSSSSGAGQATGNSGAGSTGNAGNASRGNQTTVASQNAANALYSYTAGVINKAQSLITNHKTNSVSAATTTRVTINKQTGERTTTTTNTADKTTRIVKTNGGNVIYVENQTWEMKDGKQVTTGSSGVAKDADGGYSTFNKEYKDGVAVSITKAKSGSHTAEKFNIRYDSEGKEQRTSAGKVEVVPTEVKAEEGKLSFKTGNIEQSVQTNASGMITRDSVKIYDEKTGLVMSESGTAIQDGKNPEAPVYVNFDFEWDENNTGVLTKHLQGSESEAETFVLERDEKGTETSRAKYEEEVLEDGTQVATLSYYDNIGRAKNEQDVFTKIENGDEVSYEFQMSLRDLGNGKIESILPADENGVEVHNVTDPDGNTTYDSWSILSDGTKVQAEGYPVAGYEAPAAVTENDKPAAPTECDDNGADDKVKALMKCDDRISTDENGNNYISVEKWSRSGNGNDCLSRIINNSYDLKAMGIELYSPEYNALEKAVMDANPCIYGTEEGGWRNTVAGTGRNSAVIHPGEKIVLPSEFDGTPIQKAVTPAPAYTPSARTTTSPTKTPTVETPKPEVPEEEKPVDTQALFDALDDADENARLSQANGGAANTYLKLLKDAYNELFNEHYVGDPYNMVDHALSSANTAERQAKEARTALNNALSIDENQTTSTDIDEKVAAAEQKAIQAKQDAEMARNYANAIKAHDAMLDANQAYIDAKNEYQKIRGGFSILIPGKLDAAEKAMNDAKAALDAATSTLVSYQSLLR